MNKRDSALYIIFILIIALAFFLRLYHLDERVFHHDEAAVGYFTYKLFNDSVYSYDPSFHGPFMYYATSEMYRRIGDSDYSSRLLPALLGAGMLFLLFPLRKYTGNAGMVLAAFFLALSPSFLYYSRFYREDIFISFFTLLALVCAVKYAENHSEGGSFISRISYLFLAGVSLASMAALKENAYIAMALIVLFLFLYFIRERWYKGLLDRFKNRDRKLLIPIAEAIFLVLVVMIVFSLFYTGKVLDLHGMADAVRKAITHWYEMHRIQRMGGPYFFYLLIFALYELPLLVFGILGMFHYGCEGRKKEKLLAVLLMYWIIVDIMYLIADNYPSASRFLPTSYVQSSMLIFLPLLALGMIGILYIQNKLHAFLIYWTLSNFFVYSYVQEKVPWLVLNPLLPLAIIAACYLGELLPRSNFRSWIGAALILFLVVSMAFFVYSSVLFNYYRYTDAAEPLIQAAQPPQKYSIFLDKVKEISSQYQNQSTPIQLTDVNLETQFLWYMRHYPNIKWKVSLDAELNAPLIVVHDSDGVETEADVVGRSLSRDYKRLNSSKMSWYWFKPSDITLDYLLFRKMDREPGGYRFVLYYKPKIEN
ncbi:MAG: TIGR03663 family protein [Candidatus Methanoperedens sp.]|nr:TIGR03663 family protein [Candidatus Methanoperedens sp.]